MAKLSSLVRSGLPQSDSLLERFSGDTPLRQFLSTLSWDRAELFDDFARLDTSIWTVANAGTAPVNFAAAGGIGGLISGGTGTTANNLIVVYSPAVFGGDVFFETRLRLNPVTSVALEVGLQEVATAENARVVTNWQTPATDASVSDLAMFVKDTARTDTALAAIVKGSGSGQATYAVATGRDLTANTFVRLGIRVAAPDYAEFFVNGSRVAAFDRGTDSDGVLNASTALRAVVRVQTLNTTSKVCDVDYIAVVCDRA